MADANLSISSTRANGSMESHEQGVALAQPNRRSFENLLRTAVEVRVGAGTHARESSAACTRVTVVSPCFNRPQDAAALIQDLASQRLDDTIRLHVLLVDNASDRPLRDIPIPEGLSVEHIRLPQNVGGSGGYSAGIAAALSMMADARTWPTPLPLAAQTPRPDFVWLLDSDARVGPEALTELVRVMRRDLSIVACGAAIADPVTGQVFEIGGRICRRTGIFEPAVPGGACVRGSGPQGEIECAYVAACCALVRADAILATGLFPDTFLNGDDVEWCVRLAQRTGGRIVAAPWIVAMHPRFDRFPTWTRYYTTRNAQGPLQAIDAPRRVRFARAMRDAIRAGMQAALARPDLAKLHIAGLRDASKGKTRGIAAAGLIDIEPSGDPRELTALLRLRFGDLTGTRIGFHPRADGLTPAEQASLRSELSNAGAEPVDLPAPRGELFDVPAAAWRWIRGPQVDVAIVPTRARADGLYYGRWVVQLAPGACVIRKQNRWTAASGVLAFLRGMQLAWTASGSRSSDALEGVPGPQDFDVQYAASQAQRDPRTSQLSVDVIVLSYNRWAALEQTLSKLLDSPAFGTAEQAPRARRRIIVVDNASSDGTPERVEMLFGARGVELVRLESNLGIEAFNRGVARSTADAVLILDDDAVPEDQAMLAALGIMARNERVGAVTLLPVHPVSKRAEWSFASRYRGRSMSDCPVMGCCNLVRRDAWARVGGYASEMFLYRNDVDLALKLLGAGYQVMMNPAMIAWHDTAAGAGKAKSERWHELATRNWIWLGRRHGQGSMKWCGMLFGWAWAHRLAGFSFAKHRATLRGAWTGLRTDAPQVQHDYDPNLGGAAYARLIRMLLGRE